MVFVPPRDRVLERSTSNSQSVFSVTGATDTSYNAFSASMSVGDTTIGGIVEAGVAFKSGLLTYSATGEITVTTAFESKGTFSASGVKEVFMGLPASRTLMLDGPQSLTATLQRQGRENLGASVGIPDVIIEDQKANMSHGGTATAGSPNTRDLNTLVRNVGSLAALSANQFTLPAGAFFIAWSAGAWRVDQHQTILRNVTDNTNAAIGTTENTTSAADSPATRSFGSAVVTIAAAKAFTIQHAVSVTRANTGFGPAAGFGVGEKYTRVEITRLN